MPTEKQLATYLKDHHAGSTGGISLARRIAKTAENGEGPEMSRIADEIEKDAETLETMMDRLEVPPSRFKQAGAWVGEKLGRGKLRASAPAGRVLQLEAMAMGVTGKLELWRSLHTLAAAGDARFSKTELRGLIRRAEDQRRSLEKLHGQAVRSLKQDD